jgi:hypothetical protein
MEQEPRPRKPGTFLPGHDPRRKPSHRPKGSLNKVPNDLRREIMAGFARHGEDGNGKNGLSGFAYLLAQKHPRQAARLLERLLPLTINGNGLSPQMIGTINVLSVPSNQFLSEDAIKQFSPRPLLELNTPAEQIEQDACAPIEDTPASEADNEINDDENDLDVYVSKARRR